MKKKMFLLSVFAVLFVVSAASLAFAHVGRGEMRRDGVCAFHSMGQGALGRFERGRIDGLGRRAFGNFPGIEPSREIQDKQAEMNKLRDEIRSEIAKKPINRAKIETLFKKRVQLRDEISTWFVKQYLDELEKSQK